MSVASLAGYLNNGGGGGGNVNDIIAGNGILIQDNGGDYTIENNGVISATNGAGINTVLNNNTGDLTITNTGVTSIIAGDGININNSTGNVNITSTVNPTDYLTTTDAASTYQTLTDMADYSTTTEANALYQTQAGMTDYLTTTTAGTTYQTQAAMANYSTTAQANGLYQSIGDYVVGVGISNIQYIIADIANTQPDNTGVTANSYKQFNFNYANIIYSSTHKYMANIIQAGNFLPVTLETIINSPIDENDPNAGTEISVGVYNAFDTDTNVSRFDILLITVN